MSLPLRNQLRPEETLSVLSQLMENVLKDRTLVFLNMQAHTIATITMDECASLQSEEVQAEWEEFKKWQEERRRKSYSVGWWSEFKNTMKGFWGWPPIQ